MRYIQAFESRNDIFWVAERVDVTYGYVFHRGPKDWEAVSLRSNKERKSFPTRLQASRYLREVFVLQ